MTLGIAHRNHNHDRKTVGRLENLLLSREGRVSVSLDTLNLAFKTFSRELQEAGKSKVCRRDQRGTLKTGAMRSRMDGPAGHTLRGLCTCVKAECS